MLFYVGDRTAASTKEKLGDILSRANMTDSRKLSREA
jgi:hypothetical protein